MYPAPSLRNAVQIQWISLCIPPPFQLLPYAIEIHHYLEFGVYNSPIVHSIGEYRDRNNCCHFCSQSTKVSII